MKNTLEEINSRLNDAEKQISNMEEIEITEAEQKKRMKRNSDSLSGLWETIRILRIPGEHQEKGAENTLNDIKAENYPNQGNKNLGPGNRESPK